MERPKKPKFTDHTDPDSYYNLNRYYNEAEKYIDYLEEQIEDLLDGIRIEMGFP